MKRDPGCLSNRESLDNSTTHTSATYACSKTEAALPRAWQIKLTVQSLPFMSVRWAQAQQEIHKGEICILRPDSVKPFLLHRCILPGPRLLARSQVRLAAFFSLATAGDLPPSNVGSRATAAVGLVVGDIIAAAGCLLIISPI